MAHSDEIKLKVLKEIFSSSFTSMANVAERFQVPLCCVYRWKELFLDDSLFAPAEPLPSWRFPEEDLDLLLSFIFHDPIAEIEEMISYINHNSGRLYSKSAICMILEKHNITRKVVELRAMEQNPLLRRVFAEHMKQFDPSQMVFVDETLCDPKTFRRKYGYSYKGFPAFYSLYNQLHGEGKSLSSIVALSTKGVLAYSIHQELINAETFSSSLINKIIPSMNPFPQQNSVLLLDHSRTHSPLEVFESCEEKGVICIFLPPYSYDFSPIELSFHQMKAFLKKEFPMQRIDEEKLKLAFQQIKESDSRAYFHHCGYRGRLEA